MATSHSGAGPAVNSIRNADITLYGGDLDPDLDPVAGACICSWGRLHPWRAEPGYRGPGHRRPPDQGKPGAKYAGMERLCASAQLHEWSLGSAGYITAQVDASYSDDVPIAVPSRTAVGRSLYT